MEEIIGSAPAQDTSHQPNFLGKVLSLLGSVVEHVLGAAIILAAAVIIFGIPMSLGFAIGYNLATWFALLLGWLALGLTAFLFARSSEVMGDDGILMVAGAILMALIGASAIVTALIYRPEIMRGIGDNLSIFTR